MITRKELADIARVKGLSLGNAEKDYLLDLALSSISRNTKNELVFKGGTCLYKFHKLNRFSEDLDFSAVAEIDFEKLLNKVMADFERFGMKASLHKKKEPYNSVLITLKVEGPLFNGQLVSCAHLGIDINRKSAVILPLETLSYPPIYPEISMVSALCMKQEEIFAEKIRALMTRQRARDLFDIHFLLLNGVRTDTALIKKKMDYYHEDFDAGKLISRLPNFEEYWEKELKGFTSALPDFKKVRAYVKEKLLELYHE